MVRFSGPLVTYPARATFIWFLGLILVGSLLLRLPMSTAAGRVPVSTIDALFTATSACCVTGLAVRSTPNDLSLAGQIVLLGLIQLGGIGILTITTFFAVTFGQQNLRQRVLVAQTLGATENDLRWVLWSILRYVFVAEGLGFLVLLARNLMDDKLTQGQAVWTALFHSISAFCNAGFALFDDSLVRYQGDPVYTLTIMALIVTGGLGFPVVLDLQRHSRGLRGPAWDALMLHSKLMIVGTAILVTFASGMFLALEWNHALAGKPLGTKLLMALFQAVTPRTAGFQTIELAACRDATLFMIVVLMMIGGGPCSTAGGFKVSTFMVLVVQAWSRFRGLSRVTVFRRSIPAEVVGSAAAAALLFTVVAGGALTALLVLDPPQDRQLFLSATFEVASALGTVGLSVDPTEAGSPGAVSTYTNNLSPLGKLIITALMFLGRLGPLTVFVALARSERKTRIEYPKDDVLVG